MSSKKSLSIYLYGCISGFIVATLIGMVNLYRDKGWPLMTPKTFGDVRRLSNSFSVNSLFV
jgi:hypothetical protein